MTDLLPVSVVMSVYQNAGHVVATIDSVLAQRGVEFEIVLIDDGATDQVKQVLADYNADPRIRVLSQTNQGLTKALIRGCEQAKNPLIARIDAGDVMMPDRLQAQAKLMTEQDDLGVLTSWVEICSEEGYLLYWIKLKQSELEVGATAHTADAVVAPFHASVMFRKSVYDAVGGYRQAFYFAQDCDLWPRMVEKSRIDVIEKVLTRGIFSTAGISGQYRAQQSALTALVAEANSLRACNKCDADVVLRARAIKPVLAGQVSTSETFSTTYFIAKCLSDRRSAHAREYWLRALRLKPYKPLLWICYLRSLLLREVN